MAELTEVMKHRQGYYFINILCKIWKGETDEDVELTLKSRFFSKYESLYLESVVHSFSKNKPVEHHNGVQLDKVDSDFVSIEKIDEMPRQVKLTNSQVEATGTKKTK